METGDSSLHILVAGICPPREHYCHVVFVKEPRRLEFSGRHCALALRASEMFSVLEGGHGVIPSDGMPIMGIA